MTLPLIDKQDNFEIVLFQIGAILQSETEHQQELAVIAGKNPDLWKFETYLERFTPWEVFQDIYDPFPIVNIWFEDSNFDMRDGNVVQRQASVSTYNIDIYAAKPSSDDTTGYKKSDEQSAIELHRVIRLVRNIIMHPDNTYLQLTQQVETKKQNLIWSRWIQSIGIFQPQIGDRPVQNVLASRLKFNVKFNELVLTEDYEPLESIYTTVKRAEDGKVIFEAEFDTT